MGARERRLARQQPVQQHAGGEDVDAVVDGLAHVLLGRHVAGCADDRIDLRQRPVLDARDAEVGHLELAARGEDQVRRLDVAVPDLVAVRAVECVEQLVHDAQQLGLGQQPGLREHLRQVVAFDQLHRDERGGLVFAVFVDRHDARMLQAADGLRFVAKARRDRLGLLVVIDELLVDRLERHPALNAGVEAGVDDAHRAVTKHAGDRVLAQPLRVGHDRTLTISCRAASSHAPGSCACGQTTRRARRFRCAISI